MKGRTIICRDVQTLCTRLVREITGQLQTTEASRDACVALSGGSTPLPLFQELAARAHDKPFKDIWSHVHFFWVDERCVPPDHTESNYGMAREYLFNPMGTGEDHIHRIRGEHPPASEADRYEAWVRRMVPSMDNRPFFDWILLGLGGDGHTASIFPDRMDLRGSDRLYADVSHPQTGQSRITMTPVLINHATRITFLVTGSAKRAILKELGGKGQDADIYPASMIHPLHGSLEWWMDEEAASMNDHG